LGESKRKGKNMGSTFLHEDKAVPPDEIIDTAPPCCERCGKTMWLTKVETRILPTVRKSRKEYECVACGDARTVSSTDRH
jgi:hypothetical protein